MKCKDSEELPHWKQIREFNGKYFISDNGEVKNNKGRKLKGHINSRGIKNVYLKDLTGKHAYLAIHRLVAEYFIPNPHNHKFVIHIDGNKLNNRATNLEWSDTYAYCGRIEDIKLDEKFYDLLHRIEEDYGSIADVPKTDQNYIALQHLTGSF